MHTQKPPPTLRARRPVDFAAEKWRPKSLRGGGGIIANRVRHFFDLQAGSIRRDLEPELMAVRSHVLDVGCGGQPFRGLLNPAATYLGIDTTDARAHFGYDQPDTRYFSGERWPVEDGWADLVLCTETLEHVPCTDAFLAEAARCLRPGGRLLLTVPFAARWHFIPHDYWRFTPAALLRLLERASFEEVEIYARGNEVTVACYKAMALILPFLSPQGGGSASRLGRRLVGIFLAPAFILLAILGNISLTTGGGNDCLGYTVRARRRQA